MASLCPGLSWHLAYKNTLCLSTTCQKPEVQWLESFKSTSLKKMEPWPEKVHWLQNSNRVISWVIFFTHNVITLTECFSDIINLLVRSLGCSPNDWHETFLEVSIKLLKWHTPPPWRSDTNSSTSGKNLRASHQFLAWWLLTFSEVLYWYLL